MTVKETKILGVRIDLPLSIGAFEDQELELLFRRGGYSVAINAEKILTSRESAALKMAISRAALSYLDGQPVALISRMAGYGFAKTIDLPMRTLEVAQRYGLSVGLLGSTKNNGERARENILERYPWLKIQFVQDGYKEDELILEVLLNGSADVVLLGVGSPRQELLAERAMSMGFEGFIVPCGGAIDILSGAKLRAPVIVQRLGLETPYRLLQDLSRWRRYARLLRFLLRLPLALIQAMLGLRSLEDF